MVIESKSLAGGSLLGSFGQGINPSTLLFHQIAPVEEDEGDRKGGELSGDKILASR
jgi:hypothetical protein